MNIVTPDDIVEEFKVSKAKVYNIIQGLNKELKEKGYLIVAGKVSRKYFEERYYMGDEEDE